MSRPRHHPARPDRLLSVSALLPQVAGDILEPRRVTTLTYDRLVLAVGGVNKLLPVPGVAEYAHGFRGLPEALYLRDHVTRQVDPAAMPPPTSWACPCPAPSPGPSPAALDTASPEPARVAGSPGDFVSRPEGES